MADTEKITINMSVVDLGQVDLLVSEGFYSSRTDFIRTAIRNQLQTHTAEMKQAATRKMMAVGAFGFSRRELEEKCARNEKIQVKVIGLLDINHDVSPELAQATFESIEVLGVFRASDAVKAALADRIKQ